MPISARQIADSHDCAVLIKDPTGTKEGISPYPVISPYGRVTEYHVIH